MHIIIYAMLGRKTPSERLCELENVDMYTYTT